MPGKGHLSEYKMCGAEDQFGHERPVLVDRICDNVKDCENGADEDGTILGGLSIRLWRVIIYDSYVLM